MAVILSDAEREMYNNVYERYCKIGIKNNMKIIVEMEKEINHYRKRIEEFKEKNGEHIKQITDLTGENTNLKAKLEQQNIYSSEAEIEEIGDDEIIIKVKSKKEVASVDIYFQETES